MQHRRKDGSCSSCRGIGLSLLLTDWLVVACCGLLWGELGLVYCVLGLFGCKLGLFCLQMLCFAIFLLSLAF